MNVVFAPLTGNALRDWPIEHYRTLAGLILGEAAARVEVVGTGSQRPHLNAIVRSFPATRATNLAGRATPSETEEAIRRADVIVAGHSDLALRVAQSGQAIVCIFCAAQNPDEWMPRGPNVSVLSMRPPCAPCGHQDAFACPFGRFCMTTIGPEMVFAEIRRLRTISQRVGG